MHCLRKVLGGYSKSAEHFGKELAIFIKGISLFLKQSYGQGFCVRPEYQIRSTEWNINMAF